MTGDLEKEDMRAGLPILAFADAPAFAAWLEAQGPLAPGLWLKLAKKGAPERTLAKSEAIDVALCHGWIDGQLDAFDDHYWLIRFTPRKPRSKWSELNRKRAAQLLEEGRMRRAGLAQIENAKADGRWDVAYAPASRAGPPPILRPRSRPMPKRPPSSPRSREPTATPSSTASAR